MGSAAAAVGVAETAETGAAAADSAGLDAAGVATFGSGAVVPQAARANNVGNANAESWRALPKERKDMVLEDLAKKRP